jgi:rare lipoprotein A (peptidoglycan hydrolase)
MTRLLIAALAALHLLAPVADAGAARKGVASWYAWHPSEAAAGPALRRMLGPAWRGKTVTVRANGRSVRVRLTDWCQCYSGTAAERIIDLDVRAFSRLAPTSRGLLRVEVTK